MTGAPVFPEQADRLSMLRLGFPTIKDELAYRLVNRSFPAGYETQAGLLAAFSPTAIIRSASF
jgi:hypothetical protein